MAVSSHEWVIHNEKIHFFGTVKLSYFSEEYFVCF